MRINLLPPEIKERQQIRRRTVAVSMIGVLLLVGLGAFYLLQQTRLTSAENDLRAQQAINAELQQDVNELQQFDQLAAEVETSRGLIAALLENQVLWSGVLRDISLVIPGQVWLKSMTGSITAEPAAGGAATTTTTGSEGLIGSISFDGNGFDHRSVALWLARLEDVSGFVNPWLSSSTKSEIGPFEVVDFSSSVDLSTDAVTPVEGTP